MEGLRFLWYLNVVNTILKTYTSTYRDRESKFLGYLLPCVDEASFFTQLDELKSKYPDASHHCFAYRINPASIKEFSSDDSEPSGTAGLPILNQLKSFDLVNAGLVVIRYFGGTKLGKPGLIEAYGNTAKECIEPVVLQPIIPVRFYEISYPYSRENVLNKLVLNYGLIEQSAQYLANVTKILACPSQMDEAFESELSGLDHLEIHFTKKELRFIPG